MGESAAPADAVQPRTQHRPAPSACLVGQERGIRCLPVVPGSLYCDNHHPDRKARRLEITRLAARASHARRTDPEMEAWADKLDWTTDEQRTQALRDVAVLVAKGGLTPAQGNAIAALARAAAAKPPKTPPAKAPLIMEVQQYGANGNGESA